MDGAIAEFTSHGYGGSDAAGLCERLGLARSSFYNSFGSKDALYREALARYTTGGREAMRELLDSDLPAPVLLRRRLAGQLLTQAEDPDRLGCLLVNTAVELGRSMAELTELIDADRQAWLDTYAELIRRGRRARHLRPEVDPVRHAGLMHTTMAGLRVTVRIATAAEVAEQIDAFVAGWCTPSGLRTLSEVPR